VLGIQEYSTWIKDDFRQSLEEEQQTRRLTSFFSMKRVVLPVIGLVSSAAAYDKYQLSLERKRLEQEASIIAQQPLGTYEQPSKALVLMVDSQYALNQFNKFVKPVFDAGALDYELVIPKAKGQLELFVADWIWTAKQEASTWIYPTRTWWQWITMTQPKPFPRMGYHEEKTMIVAFGEDSWSEFLSGLSLASLHKAPHQFSSKQVYLKKYPHYYSAAPPLKEDEEIPKAPEFKDLTQDEFSLPLPMVSYIPGENHVGWKKFPQRVYAWFTERHSMSQLGEKALAVIQQQSLPMAEDELKELHPKLRQKMVIV
jgi:hypothetical protein